MAAPERSFRAVLVRASGPDALVILGLERGRVSYRVTEGMAELAVYIAAQRATLSEQELANEHIAPRKPQELEIARRSPASRDFASAPGQLLIANGTEELRVAASDHFASIEAIVFEHLLVFEHEPDDFDRELTLRPILPRGARP